MNRIHNSKRGVIESILIPDLDESVLFSISFTCILLFLVNNPPQTWSLSNISLNPAGVESLFFLLLLFPGFILSFLHAFTDRKKTDVEKIFMLLFAGILIGFTGIWGGTYMLVNSPNWLIAFPAWNIFCGFYLLAALRGRAVTEDDISDENITPPQVVLTSLITSLIFVTCYIWFELNWAATISICLTWATTFSNPVNSVVFKDRIKIQTV